MGEFIIILAGVFFALAISGWIGTWIWLCRTEKKLTKLHKDIWKLHELAPEAFDNGKGKKKDSEKTTAAQGKKEAG